jgi:prepilin-type N-terminal cleavage/methylation domain-containing protein
MIDALYARRRVRGFTLIEILVALLVFALLAGFGYRGLGAVLDAGERVTTETSKWRDLALAFEHMRLAFAQAAERPIRDRNDATAPAFQGVAATRNSTEALVAFTRMGYAGHEGAAADQQRVGYRLREDRWNSSRGRSSTRLRTPSRCQFRCSLGCARFRSRICIKGNGTPHGRSRSRRRNIQPRCK